MKKPFKEVVFVIVLLVTAFWLFFGSIKSFIAAKNIRGGAYVFNEYVDEVWHNESQLRRIGIGYGVLKFLLGCVAVYGFCNGLKTIKKQHSAGGREEMTLAGHVDMRRPFRADMLFVR